MRPAPAGRREGLVQPGGRGLRVVNEIATHWGATPLPDGKIVWALLRTDPRPSAPTSTGDDAHPNS
jgi:hypothetical protein